MSSSLSELSGTVSLLFVIFVQFSCLRFLFILLYCYSTQKNYQTVKAKSWSFGNVNVCMSFCLPLWSWRHSRGVSECQRSASQSHCNENDYCLLILQTNRKHFANMLFNGWDRRFEPWKQRRLNDLPENINDMSFPVTVRIEPVSSTALTKLRLQQAFLL